MPHCNEEIDALSQNRSSSLCERGLSFLFTSLIEGLSFIGFVPLCG